MEDPFDEDHRDHQVLKRAVEVIHQDESSLEKECIHGDTSPWMHATDGGEE